MPPVHEPPIGLTDQEILCVIAALQTLGGTPTVTLKTTHKYFDGTTKKGAAVRPVPAHHALTAAAREPHASTMKGVRPGTIGGPSLGRDMSAEAAQ
jgi:hypothetical protein